MDSQNGVILAMILLLSGFWLGIPSQASLAEMVVNAIMDVMEPGSPGYQTAQNVILALRIVGWLIVIGSIAYIIAYIIQEIRTRDYL